MGQRDANGAMHCTVLVVGAGVSGVALVVNLAARGVHDVQVLEMGGGIGGTWWDSRYPGAEVDVTSELYSFSFAPHVFTRTHARQAEIRAYMEDVVVSRGLMGRFEFGAKVERVIWSEADELWHVESADGRRWTARYVVSCVGQLNNPRYPAWPGMDEFAGAMYHTARWDHSVDLTGKRVAVVGTGSTSAQLVPEVAKVAERVFVYQRQPGWVIPKPDRDYTPSEMRRLKASPALVKWRRASAFVRLERMRAVAREGTRANRRMQQLAERYLRSTVHDPALRALLTPDYPYFGKRPVLTQYFYPALQRENVELRPHAVTALTRTGVVDDSGQQTLVDVVVLATGFTPSRFLATFEVTGCGGRTMREEWADDPKSFLGLMANGFPNFFVAYGPNTNGGTLTFTLERQAEWIAAAVACAERSGAVLDVRPAAVALSHRWVAKRNEQFVWSRTGNNYYTSETGKVVTQWPFTQKLYWLLVRVLPARLVCRRRTRRAAALSAAAAEARKSTERAA